MRFGTVAIIGRSNVGKSTFLNEVLGEKLAIVSALPQTTRDALLGVVTRPDAQFAFIDTPGLHRPRSELGRRMNVAALEAARSTDVVVFMTDVTSLTRPSQRNLAAETVLLDDDRRLIETLPARTPAIAVVNKVDQLKDKSRLLLLLDALGKTEAFTAYVPTSMRRHDGADRVLDEIAKALPEAPPGYDEDMLTDRPLTFFVREYVREQVLLAAHREVPHAVAVTVDRFLEGPRITRISATIHVEKQGQRAILVGKQGAMIREIGTRARQRLEQLLGSRVHLELFVRVTPRWKHADRQLAELGYETTGDGSADPLGDRGKGERESSAGRAGGDPSDRGAPRS